jgi:hypothetical protein
VLQATVAREQQELLRCLYPYGREVSRREFLDLQLLGEQRDKIIAVFSEMIARAAGGDSYSVVGVMGLTRRTCTGRLGSSALSRVNDRVPFHRPFTFPPIIISGQKKGKTADSFDKM